MSMPKGIPKGRGCRACKFSISQPNPKVGTKKLVCTNVKKINVPSYTDDFASPYWYCSVAREADNLCDLKGKYWRKKFK